MPREFATSRMINAMQVNPQVAGVCGEIAVHNPNYGSFVQAAQAFEYAIQHVLDKSFESICVSPDAGAATTPQTDRSTRNRPPRVHTVLQHPSPPLCSSDLRRRCQRQRLLINNQSESPQYDVGFFMPYSTAISTQTRR